jgi:hypothetical protein
MSPCPHCRAVAAAERSPTLRWRCAVCGAPVVPSDGSFPRGHGELPNLVGAARANAMAFGWTAATVVFAGVAALTASVALLLWGGTHGAAAILAVVAGSALALAAASGLRARARRGEAGAQIDRAWRGVTAELLAARGTALTPRDLMRALPLDEPIAEHLLAELSAEGRARVAVGEDAQLSYRVAAAEIGGAEPKTQETEEKKESESPPDTSGGARRTT